MHVKFRNRGFKVTRADLGSGMDGGCSDEYGTIMIDKRLRGRPRLDTEIHEALHACFPMVGEKVVGSAANDIGKFLWRVGYRLRRGK